MSNNVGKKWEQKERATPVFLSIIVWLTRNLGRSVGAVLLYPISLYYLLFAPKARRASNEFLSLALGRPAGWKDSFRHIHCFASTMLDRVLLFAGRSDYFDIEVENNQHMRQYLDRGQGVLLILSHLGSFEMSRILGGERSVPIKVLMDRSGAGKFFDALEQINPEITANIIDTGGSDTDRVLRVKAALDEGCAVGIMADRSHGGDDIEVNFFGRKALLPSSPWLLAGVLKVPVVLGLCVSLGGKQYLIRFEELIANPRLPRGKRQQVSAEYAQQYADRIEHYARQYPNNWFNFYPFWE